MNDVTNVWKIHMQQGQKSTLAVLGAATAFLILYFVINFADAKNAASLSGPFFIGSALWVIALFVYLGTRYLTFYREDTPMKYWLIGLACLTLGLWYWAGMVVLVSLGIGANVTSGMMGRLIVFFADISLVQILMLVPLGLGVYFCRKSVSSQPDQI